jgi:hypothetical protein
MKTLKMMAMGLTVFCLGAIAWADPAVRDAGSKMRDEAITGHEYRAAQRAAQERSYTLYHYYAQPQPIIKPEHAKEIVGAIKKDLTASDKALAKLKAAHAKEPEVVKLIESIEKHHARAHDVCGMAEEECAKEHGDHVMCSECCADMWHELDAAKADTAKLFKMLNIKELEPPKKADVKKSQAAKK